MPKLPNPSRLVHRLVVRRAATLPGEGGPRGLVKIGRITLVCALGRTGTTRRKVEGDKATPVGTTAILRGYYRPDKMARPLCRVPLTPADPGLAWCDEPASPLYNRPGRLPMRGSHEALWRHDGLYDVVFVLDYNLHPRRARRGSAIFLHCAQPTLSPTLGCVALRPCDMRRLLPRLAAHATLTVL